MARVKIELAKGWLKAFNVVATSDAVAAQLEPIAEAVKQAASSDPNPNYVASLRVRKRISSGQKFSRSRRVVFQVGAAPGIGERVEARRGTLARALGQGGLK